MTKTIPDSHRDLIDGPVVVALSTVMPDGRPQCTPVWCSFDGNEVLINSARGRQKDKNMVARPGVAVLAIDPQNPYRYLEVRGDVTDVTEDGARDHINALAKTYVGKDEYYGGVAPAEAGEAEVRVIYRITPTRVSVHG
ncbi:MAG: PPOX class F420-dependent oxidoreductase [Alphaproteobacteria bacterium]|jgi:PPOX class probable F420-dependent enzyme|nr:PPOX class F420-dependent oxidoreductase [Alphaproteobacteria bacterium]MDP6567740.1 PPOX class F420-dependent oxidoreductase [Alphaproteobacteria bacterium]MDP6815195.1 PPOX class F420-dependent oxidoreductase [Alphaproteobacteria bacterium]